MSKQVPVNDSAVAPTTDEDGLHVIADDVAYQRLAIVNVAFVGTRSADDGGGSWVLVDAGVPGMAGRIRHAAEKHFGVDKPPVAIVLTHGHFDHVGSLEALLEEWDVPVYAHADEIPYLNGTKRIPRRIQAWVED